MKRLILILLYPQLLLSFERNIDSRDHFISCCMAVVDYHQDCSVEERLTTLRDTMNANLIPSYDYMASAIGPMSEVERDRIITLVCRMNEDGSEGFVDFIRVLTSYLMLSDPNN